jgi:hypothetical protein
MAETIVHEGHTWTLTDDGTILHWVTEAEEWSPWDPEAGPQPPKVLLRQRRKLISGLEADERARTRQQQAAEEQFRQSPQGQARTAREAGARFFQIVLPVSLTTPAMFGQQPIAFSSIGIRTTHIEQSRTLELIEGEGWELQHVGYVFQQTGAQSRDRFLATGQIETVVGQLTGIYLFRASGSTA